MPPLSKTLFRLKLSGRLQNALAKLCNYLGDFMDVTQFNRMRSGKGFVAALDQSGGSTPKALELYGIPSTKYKSESEMFDRVHEMRTRIITNPVFNSDRILGVILFEMTMDRSIDGVGSAEYLWEKKSIVPFLKIDNGLAVGALGVQQMKVIFELTSRLKSARSHSVFGTKMRSVIKSASKIGINHVVDQQFELAKVIQASDLIPIIEPEVAISSPEKEKCELLLKSALVKALDKLNVDQNVILKLTLPNIANYYAELSSHPRVIRVLGLSGGYTRLVANSLLASNTGMIASFSRGLTEGLSINQSEDQFTSILDASIQSIYDASTIKNSTNPRLIAS